MKAGPGNMETRRNVACLKIRRTTFRKVKYAPTKLKGTTKHEIMASKTSGRALQKEI